MPCSCLPPCSSHDGHGTAGATASLDHPNLRGLSAAVSGGPRGERIRGEPVTARRLSGCVPLVSGGQGHCLYPPAATEHHAEYGVLEDEPDGSRRSERVGQVSEFTPEGAADRVEPPALCRGDPSTGTSGTPAPH